MPYDHHYIKEITMKRRRLCCILLTVFLLAAPLSSFAEQQPEMVAEKIAIKFTRGMVNSLTSIVELPKQTALTVRSMGAPGIFVGTIKGLGMTLYRTFIGATETVFCMVPQPGYYDSMIDPSYVWEGWEPREETVQVIPEESKQPQP